MNIIGRVQLTMNHSLDFPVERLVWEGKEFPWDIQEIEIRSDYYSGYEIIIWSSLGKTELTARELEYIDNTPPAPKCECCGQEIKNK